MLLKDNDYMKKQFLLALVIAGMVSGTLGTVAQTIDGPLQPAKLNISVRVINHGGHKSASQFQVYVDGMQISGSSAVIFNAGIHTVSVTNDNNYTVTFSGDCDAIGSVTLLNGVTRRCTITFEEKVANKIACVGAAAAMREGKIDSTLASYTSSISSAYATRSLALAHAYTQTTADGVKNATKSAWNNFKDSVKNARTSWQNSKKDAWAQFRTDVKNCGISGSFDDGSNSGSEISGS